MHKPPLLLTPGPTPLPPEVSQAMAKPIIYHRSPQFEKLFGEVREDLKYLFRTKNDVIIFASSGTGGMEAAVANFFSRNILRRDPVDRPEFFRLHRPKIARGPLPGVNNSQLFQTRAPRRIPDIPRPSTTSHPT